PEVRIGGVIFNNVSSENHARILKEAVETAVPSIRVVGSILRDNRLQIPSRHLGLLTAEENELSTEYLDHLVEVIRGSVDIGMLWAIAGAGDVFELPAYREPAPSAVKIAVARDRAFCFVYESNLRLLRQAVAELVEFSPLADSSLPDGISGIYLPGGYPGAHAAELSANIPMKEAIRVAIESGLPVYAECGGFIYLTSGVAENEEEGRSLKELIGVFPVATTMLKQRKALGYREIKLRSDSVLGKEGATARGHEFHYSRIDEMPEGI